MGSIKKSSCTSSRPSTQRVKPPNGLAPSKFQHLVSVSYPTTLFLAFLQLLKWLPRLQSTCNTNGGSGILLDNSQNLGLLTLPLSRTNAFLDRFNDEFFRPHGLYCLIMAYHPNPLQNQDKVDVAETISPSIATPGKNGFFRKMKTNLCNPCSGKTHREDNLPAKVAPLIFHEDLKSTRRSTKRIVTTKRL